MMQFRSSRQGSQPDRRKAKRKKPTQQTVLSRANRVFAIILFAFCFPFLCWGAFLVQSPAPPSPQSLIETDGSNPDAPGQSSPLSQSPQNPSGPKITLASMSDTPSAADSGSPATNAPTSEQGFVGGLGHVTDVDTGLIYMRARYYDPAIGRFISEDPVGSGRNWYTYADNNPVNHTDYTGKSTTGDGELDYDIANINAGFGIAAAITAIYGGVAIREQLASDGVYSAESNDAETEGATQRDHNAQDVWWKSQLKKRGLSAEDGRSLHDMGIGSRYGYTDEEIEEEMDKLAEEKYGTDDGG